MTIKYDEQTEKLLSVARQHLQIYEQWLLTKLGEEYSDRPEKIILYFNTDPTRNSMIFNIAHIMSTATNITFEMENLDETL